VVLLALVLEGEDTPLLLCGEAEGRDPVGDDALGDDHWHE